MNLRATQRKSRENRAAAGLGQVSRHTAVVLLASSLSTLRKIKTAWVWISRRRLTVRRGEYRKLKLLRFAEDCARTVRARMPWAASTSTRPEQLAQVLSDPNSASTVAEDFRLSPRVPGCFSGEAPEVSSGPLHLAVEKALRRVVDLQGSGPIHLGRPINWHMDHISGYIWPRVHHSRLVPVEPGMGADCRFPWGLARCQNWPHLAAAQEQWQEATVEMLSQFKEFTAANPPGIGITYASAMDVAIRSANWLSAFRSAAGRLINRDIDHLCVEMAAAGYFIRESLQRNDATTQPHQYAVGLFGLYLISTMFPSLKDSSEWYRFSRAELSRELDRQFDGAGGHIEGAPSYGRLVLECYLYAYVLGQEATDPSVVDWSDRLKQIIDHQASLMLPNGELPHIGDDDAPLLLSPPGESTEDFRYVLQVGSVLLKCSDWKRLSGEDPRPGLDFWLGPEGVRCFRTLSTGPASLTNRVWHQAGMAVKRTPTTYLLIQGGRSDIETPRGLLHNDLTSLEFFADGERWLIDPGTYQVFRQPVWRNRFRSTSAHNVIQLDGREQNQMAATQLSELPRDAVPLPIEHDHEQIRVGYGRRAAGTDEVILRHIEASTDVRLVNVIDRVEGQGRHSLVFRLNLARMPFTWLEPGLLVFRGTRGDFLLHLRFEDRFSITVGDGWYSPRYGVRDRCFRISAEGQAILPVQLNWCFAAVPPSDNMESWIRKLKSNRGTSEVMDSMVDSGRGSSS